MALYIVIAVSKNYCPMYITIINRQYHFTTFIGTGIHKPIGSSSKNDKLLTQSVTIKVTIL